MKKQNYPDFFCYYINSNFCQNYFKSVMWGAAQNNLSVPIIKEIQVPIPPNDEQKEIVEHLKFKISEIDSLIIKTESQIEKLQEFRQSLITSAVTGKIDVTRLND